MPAATSPHTKRTACEAFVRQHFTAAEGKPRRLAEIAVSTGFYSSKVALSQIAWRFQRTILALISKP
jgi:hypothetical protein